ncbi:MAG: hypothetical protein ABJP45_02465, partial [Cyclobacteriaceae bacterium]
MSTYLIELLAELNRYSGIPGIVFFLLMMRKNGNIRIVFFVLLASFTADVTIYFFIRHVYPNSFIISNTWYLIDYGLLTWLFIKMIPERKGIVALLGIIFTIGGITSFLFFYSFLESNTFIKAFHSLAFTVLSIIAFFEVLRESPTDKLIHYPVFWIMTAIFLFSSVTLFKNLFQNYLIFELALSMESYAYVHSFNNVFNILKNLMFLYAFVLVKKG